ncbi:MAG: hypothetical protein K2M05_05035 [Paramuribaculum sp.]|nr:hypothetical protein [Paramuribaculum sp.]
MNTLNISKLIASLSALLLLALPVAANDTTAPDSVMRVPGPAKVIITEDINGLNFDIQNDGESAFYRVNYPPTSRVRVTNKTYRSSNPLSIKLSERGHSSTGMSMDGVCLGLTNPCSQSAPGGLQWSKSIEISWLSCINLYYETGRSRYSIGLGFDWRNYKTTTSDKCLTVNQYGGLEWSNYPENVDGRFSRLKVFSLQLPALWSYNFPKTDLGLKAGVILNFNTYASVKTGWYNSDGKRENKFSKQIEQNKFTVDFFGSLSICHTFGIYVRYSPMNVIDLDESINFRPLTLGVTIGI